MARNPVKRSSKERYKELAAGLLVAAVSEGIQLILPNVINLVPVLIIVGLMAPLVDDTLMFLAGFAIVSVVLALLGSLNAALFAFDILFAVAASLSFVLTRKGFRKNTYERNYVTAAAIAAIIFAGAYIFFATGAPSPIMPSTTTTSLGSTTVPSTVATTTAATTTILKYSGCSTIEYDQPFHCQNPVLSAPANLSFTLSSNDTNDTLLNIDLACTSSFNLSTPSKYDFYYLQANGTLSQGQYGTSITAGSPIRATGLPCFGVANASAPFTGILWVAYHPGSQATPLQTTHIQVYYNTTSVPKLTHVNSSV